MTMRVLLGIAASSPLVTAGIDAGSILIIDDSFNGAGFAARQGLESAGWSVTETSSMPTSLDGYDQVWDVRYLGGVTEGERGMFRDYLAAGGRMLFTGENNGQSFRNFTVRQMLEGAGSGQVIIENTAWTGMQDVTGAGAGVFDYSRVRFDAASLFREIGNGTLLTALSDDPTRGSIVGWGLGDLADAEAGAVIAALDINFFSGAHERGTDTISAMLARALASGAVPAPGAGLVLAGGLLSARRRR